MNDATDGLARIQSESRIPASTWRQWCDHLGLPPVLAVELWDDVCHPMQLAGGQTPDIALLMQLRACQPEAMIDDFRDDLAPVLLTIGFVDALQETKGTRAALLRLYRALGASGKPVARPFVAHAASLGLLDGVLLDDVTLPRLVKVLCLGKSRLADLCQLGRRALGNDPRREVVEEALDAALALLAAPASQAPAVDPAEEPAAEEPTQDPAEDEAAPEPVASETPPPQDTDEEDDGPAAPPDPMARFVDALRAAAAAIYAGDDVEPDLRRARLQAIGSFHPLASRIPTMEEARHLSRKSAPTTPSGGASRASAGRAMAAGRGASRGTPGSGTSRGSSGSGSSGRGGGVSILRSAQAATGTSGKPPTSDGDSTVAASPTTARAPAVDTAGKLPAPSVGRHELDAAVATVAEGLTAVRETDPRVWALFTDEAHDLEAPRALADELAVEGSPAARAAAALRAAAQQQRVRAILSLPPDKRMKERRFDLEAEGWLNAIANHRRALDPDSRQLISLPRVLDRAAAGLVRVEALRAAVALVAEAPSPETIAVEAVTQRYETLLVDVTYLADSNTVSAARQRADGDAAVVLAQIAADGWVTRVADEALAWVDAAVAAGAADSPEAVQSYIDATPLRLDAPTRADDAEPPAEVPAGLLADTALGEVVDGLRRHVLRATGPALTESHDPPATLRALDGRLRQRLRRHARITVRRERHARNPRVALPVASLERLSGNPELADLFVRLSPDGNLHFVADFEDGSYVDLFELRESQRKQMQARASERARGGQAATQTGASYLHTLGRTNAPFATSRADVLAGCIVDDDGEPVIYFDPA